tara:strand:- start:27119 stop:27745 length:627 start_codon:yes stop_codon:yes gene_type:complete
MKVLASAAILISLNISNWQKLDYSSIPPNEVEQKSNSMLIHVKQSASPLIYLLEKPVTVTSVHLLGKVDKIINFVDEAQQGDKKYDDFQMRLGLVVAGDKKLNALQRTFAAKWVKKLFHIGKERGEGIDHIEFLNLAGQNLPWQSRIHPLSDLIREKIVGQLSEAGEFELKHKLKQELKVVALWLSVDGDDTKSSYSVQIDQIQLNSL